MVLRFYTGYGANSVWREHQVHRIGGIQKTLLNKGYILWLGVETPKGVVTEHKVLCYGLERMAEVSQSVTTQQLQWIFFFEIWP